MGVNVKHERNMKVNSGVVEAGKSSSNKNKEYHRNGVHLLSGNEASKKEQREQMKILPTDVLKRVIVNGIRVSTEWRHLTMMMLVHKRVDGGPVKSPMEEGIEEIIDHNQGK